MRSLLLLLLATVALAGCRYIVRAELTPNRSFAETQTPAEPDYRHPAFWAARPERVDLADVAPLGEEDRQAEAAADVFFVHPTTYYDEASWNQPLGDPVTNERTDRGVLRNQASAFNSAGRVFAPRYRQATLASFLPESRDQGDLALSLAYGDVLAAFDHYLAHDNDGRPIILASHSQGSFHALRLLRDRFSGTALRERLVAAYVIGIAIPTDVFERVLPDIPLCTSATQTGCVVTWNTVGARADRSRFYGRSPVPYATGYESNLGKTLACVNPLIWTADDVAATRADNLGGVRFPMYRDGIPEPDPGLVSARCVDGLLVIDRPERAGYLGAMGPRGDYHVVDYGLFYMNIRRNAEARVAVFVADMAQPGY